MEFQSERIAVQDNPDSVDHADTVVGIPSFEEADTIGFVAKQIAGGLEQCSSAGEGVIINTDNNSPDGTREAFLETDTESIPKIYLSTPEGMTGKGNNVWNLFTATRTLNGRWAMMIDGDLKSIEQRWIRSFLTVLEDGNDFVLPLYGRNEYDGSITNHICYPLLRGVLNIDARQPIGGEFAFSARYIDYILNLPWVDTTYQYGIDIFLSTNALVGDFNVAQVHLGAKIHKPSAPKLGPMFRQVVDTLFTTLHEHTEHWMSDKPALREIKTYGSPPENGGAQHMAIDYKKLREQAVQEFRMFEKHIKATLTDEHYKTLKTMFDKEERPAIDAELWTTLLYHVFYTYGEAKPNERADILDALAPLWMGRSVSFIRETLDLSHEESEHAIQDQAQLFLENRSYLLEHYTD